MTSSDHRVSRPESNDCALKFMFPDTTVGYRHCDRQLRAGNCIRGEQEKGIYEYDRSL